MDLDVAAFDRPWSSNGNFRDLVRVLGQYSVLDYNANTAADCDAFFSHFLAP